MKRLALYMILAIIAIAAHAATEWTLQGKTYYMDTVAHFKAGPGTTLTSLRLSGAQNLNVFYTVTDLTDENIEVRTLKAKNTIYAREKVSAMALSNDSDTTQYFLGVNADFFNMRRGNSIGSHIIDGEIYYLDDNGRTQWAIDKNRTTYMDIMDISCIAFFNNLAKKITAVNKVPTSNSLNLYTSRYGTKTDTASNAIEVALIPTSSPLSVGKKTAMKVATSPSKGGSTTIPLNGYILSGSGNESQFINDLAAGDTIELSATISLPNEGNICPTEVISGYPVILRDGKTTNPIDILKHLNGVHPRTAIGNDASGSKLIILIVDGRSKESEGCTSHVLADIMRNVGCDDAMNLDGGGSSELYIKTLGICNVPSDGKERTVANGIFIAANVPADNEIASIEFADFKKNLNVGETYTPTFYGYNKYGILIDPDVKGVKLSCPKQLGKTTSKGTSIIAKSSGNYILSAKLGKLKANVTVNVK